jgi:hypothetical protein
MKSTTTSSSEYLRSTINPQTIPINPQAMSINYSGSDRIILQTPSQEWGPFTWTIVIIFIIILIAFGLNLFTYLATGKNYISDIMQNSSGELPEKVKKIISKDVIGFNIDAKKGITKSAETKETDSSALLRELDDKRYRLWGTRDKGVEQDIGVRRINGKKSVIKSSYKESSGGNNIQETHKKGYCYIGSDRGHRSCIKVDSEDDCESSKIFPTMDTCRNPSLR